MLRTVAVVTMLGALMSCAELPAPIPASLDGGGPDVYEAVVRAVEEGDRELAAQLLAQELDTVDARLLHLTRPGAPPARGEQRERVEILIRASVSARRDLGSLRRASPEDWPRAVQVLFDRVRSLERATGRLTASPGATG